MSESVAVLIITRNRALPLKKCLRSLEGQTRRADQVVIVDNGSSDNTAAVISSFEASLPIQRAYEGTPSIPRCRNIALRAATTDLAVFLDDDCIAQPAWISEGLRVAATRPTASVMQGRIQPSAARLVGKAVAFNDVAYVRRYYGSGTENTELRYMATANLMFRMKALKDFSPWFDESLPRSSDREFAVRLRTAGRRIIFCPKMVVTHDYDNRSLAAACRTFFHRAKGRVAVQDGTMGDDARNFAGLLKDLLGRIIADPSIGPATKAGILAVEACFYLSSAVGICYWSALRFIRGR